MNIRMTVAILALGILLININVNATPTINEQAAENKGVFIPIYNPQTDKIEYRYCENYPTCGDLDLIPPAENSDEDIEE